MKKIIFSLLLIIIALISCKKETNPPVTDNNIYFHPDLTYGSMTDIGGNSYKTIQIGNQTWMAQNLNYKSDNGWWVYDNDMSYAANYGRLYNWETACEVCPDGWHLPSDDEWTELIDYLNGGYWIAGSKMKESGTTHWNIMNQDATNESGFTALPGGGGYINEIDFRGIGDVATFWSSTEIDKDYAWNRRLHSSSGSVERKQEYKDIACSIRCVKD